MPGSIRKPPKSIWRRQRMINTIRSRRSGGSRRKGGYIFSIYIYIERERERERYIDRKRETYIYIEKEIVKRIIYEGGEGKSNTTARGKYQTQVLLPYFKYDRKQKK